MRSQFDTVGGGMSKLVFTGINRAALTAAMDLRDVKREKRSELFDLIKIIEVGAAAALNNRSLGSLIGHDEDDGIDSDGEAI